MVLKILKWIGIGLGGLIGLLVIAGVVLVIIGGARASKKYDVPVQMIEVPTDVASIEHGEHVALIHYCQECHGNDLSGKSDFSIPGLLTIPTPNLTSGEGGVGSFYTDEDWIRAVRHGVGHDGRALWIMPSENFSHLSDEDTGALIAYLKSLPAVDSNLPERKLEPVG